MIPEATNCEISLLRIERIPQISQVFTVRAGRALILQCIFKEPVVESSHSKGNTFNDEYCMWQFKCVLRQSSAKCIKIIFKKLLDILGIFDNSFSVHRTLCVWDHEGSHLRQA